jgi:hypothetical protein
VAGVRKVPRYQRRACKEKLKKFKKVLDKAGGWWYNKVIIKRKEVNKNVTLLQRNVSWKD